MRWHHAYSSYDLRSGLKGKKEHVVKWWDTQEGEREFAFEKPEMYYREVLAFATRHGWEFVAKGTHAFIFKKPVE